VKRRELITLLGAAAAWPLAARAQQGERVRRIGVLMNLAADDPEALARLAAFHQGLQERAGWWGAIYGLTIVGERAMPTASADTRRSWSLSCPRSSWQLPARPCRGCYRRRVACPSCSRRPLIQSAPASSRASLIRAVMSLGSPISITQSAENFWNCLRTSRLA